MSYIEPAPFVEFDPASGAITRIGQQAIGFTRDAIEQGQPLVFADRPLDMMRGSLTHYVDPTTRTLCPKWPGQAVLVGDTLSGLPVPCRIAIHEEGQMPVLYDHDEPDLRLSFWHPGTYRIEVTAVPCLTQDFTYENA